MDYRAFNNKIDELYDAICEIENRTKESFASNDAFIDIDLRQEDYDFSDIYSDLVTILIPMLEFYQIIFRTPRREKAQKVYYVALCEMIKQDYNRGMLITFRNVTGESEINTNRYYDLIQRVSDSQGLRIKKINGRRQFEEAYILETGIPRNLTSYVIKMFKIYWRYFREFPTVERLEIIHDYLSGKELLDEYILDHNEAKLFDTYSSYLRDFPEKAIKVFDKLDLIFSAFDQYADTVDQDNRDEIVGEVSKQVGFDITTVLRDSELSNLYSIYLKQVPVNKFFKILNNLPRLEAIITPTGDSVTVSKLQISNIACGEYKIRGNTYYVVVDPNVKLEEMVRMQCDTVIQLSTDYYCYISRNDFQVECNGVNVLTRKLIYRNQVKNIWFGRVQPASIVVVDGNTIVSSEKYKHNYRIHKKYDYEKKINNLCITINSVRANNPELPFGKLYISINGKDKKMLCVGNNKGIYYAENISEIISDKDYCEVEYWINDESILKESISLLDTYVFDKWNGTEYKVGSNNDKHSGAFVIFSVDPVDMDGLEYNLTASYKDGIYHVYELERLFECNELTIGDEKYSFSRAGRPAIFIKSETGNIELIDDINSISLIAINLKEGVPYRLFVENKGKNWLASAENGEILLSNIIPNSEYSCTGKWFISLWEGQRKIDSVEFNMIPQIEVVAGNRAVLEGKDVYVKIKASEACFISEVGEYSSTTEVNLGSAYLVENEGEFISDELEYYIYIDNLGISKKVVFTPILWGIRTKDIQTKEWNTSKSILLDASKPQDSKIALISNGLMDVWVNGKGFHYTGGLHEIDYLSLIGELKRKNEVVITDDNSTEKVVLACNPSCRFGELITEDELVVVLKYIGPVDQKVSIRTFVDSFKSNVYEKTANKNQMNFYIPFGGVEKLKGKKIAVDVCMSKSGIPTKVFEQVIEVSSKKKDARTKERDQSRSLSDYTRVIELIKHCDQHDKKQRKIDVDSIMKRIEELR